MKISKILHHPATIRSVDKDGIEFENLKLSIEARGLLVPLTVCQIDDQKEIILLDGQYRLEACKDLGMVAVPTYPIAVMTSEDFEVSQLMKSVHTIPTKPVEYSKAIIRLLSHSDPKRTFREMCKKLCVTDKWLTMKLKLDRLHPMGYKVVSRGDVCLINGYMLSQLPYEDQEIYVDRAKAHEPKEFVLEVQARLKQLREMRSKTVKK